MVKQTPPRPMTAGMDRQTSFTPQNPLMRTETGKVWRRSFTTDSTTMVAALATA